MRVNFLFQMLICGTIGVVLFTGGIDFNDWQYWVTLLLLCAYGVSCWVDGKTGH